VLTPVRVGGPYSWGGSLAACVSATGRFSASHFHRPSAVLASPLRQDADLVHTAIPLSVRLWRKPVVLTVHGDYSIENKLWKLMYPAAVRMADAVTVPSRFLKDRLGLDDAQIIPNAIFPERYSRAGGQRDGPLSLVTVTKFYFEDKARGVLDLLRILDRALQSRDREVRLTVVGGGRYLDPVARKAASFRVPVRFTGFLDNPAEVLKQADIFVYYSDHDNFPLTLLEAMATSLPVLTNDVGAAREILGDGEGMIAGTDEEYAGMLGRLLGDAGLRRAMGQRARRKVEEQFSWHTVAAQYISLYDRLLGN
jgi:glycosyltransferase involved in cell wall biosynthesis